MVSDAMRAVDYLSSRGDVDPTRIGSIGCSGGGAMTEYLAALDSRIKAIAAACSMNVSSNAFTNTGDSEQSPMDLISYGLDYPDFAEVLAPKPYLILTTTEDNPAAPTAAYNEASAFYNIYGAATNIQLVIGPGPHGQPLQDRQALYAWMIRWIGGGVTDPTEVAVTLVPDASLQATTSGLVGGDQIYQILGQGDGPGSATLEQMLAFLQNQMPYSGYLPIAGAPQRSGSNRHGLTPMGIANSGISRMAGGKRIGSWRCVMRRSARSGQWMRRSNTNYSRRPSTSTGCL
jgi:hypothetical protein